MNSNGLTVLGLHRDPWHDTGACIVRETPQGLFVVAISEERLTRVKNCRAFPDLSIQYCLEAAGLQSVDEVDLIVSDYICVQEWGKDVPPNKSHDLLGPDGLGALQTGRHKIDPAKVKVINHHLCHAAGAFYGAPFEEAAVLIVDGRGSNKETQSLYHGTKDGLKLVAKTDHLGIGLMYATVTQHIGFKLLQEGKTMGLGPYGDTSKPPTILPHPQTRDGIVVDYRNWCVGRYENTLGAAPTSDQEKEQIAAEAQHLLALDMRHRGNFAKEQTGSKNLCMSGGVGLNSVANWRLTQEGPFDQIFVHPACSDSGIPMGAALYGYYEILGGTTPWKMEDAYTGKLYDQDDIDQAIEQFEGFQVVREDALSKAAQLLADGLCVGWFDGRSEYGPRALGHRSILVDPTKAENKDRLNARVKFREAFRPFAPIVPWEHAQEYFQLDRPAPFMLLVPKVVQGKESEIPAVTHVDGSARVQTIERDVNPRMHALLLAFRDKTGVPVLLNTSFNVAGEPIVETPADAIRCFSNTAIDALVLSDTLLIKDEYV